jgi:hypothetical protein
VYFGCTLIGWNFSCTKKEGISKRMWWAFSFSKCLLFSFFWERVFEITETREFVLKLQITAQDWCCSIYLTTKSIPPSLPPQTKGVVKRLCEVDDLDVP